MDTKILVLIASVDQPMSEIKLQVIIGATILIFILGSAFYFYWLQRKPERFTRDRFAFSGLAVLSSLTLALVHTFSGTTLWDIALAELRWATTGKYELPEATGEGKFLIVLCVFIVAYTIIKLHREWPGKVTEEQWKSRQLSEHPNIIFDGVAELKRVLTRSPEPQLHDPGKRREFSKIETPTSSAQFSVIARDLFCEVRRDAIFDKDEKTSWHERGGFWTGRDRRTEAPLVLFCTGSSFSSVGVESSISYLKKLKNFGFSRAEFFQIRRRSSDYTITAIDGRPVTSYSIDNIFSSLIDIENYKENIYQRVAVEMLPNSELTISDTYTPSKITKEPLGSAPQLFSDFVGEWLSDAKPSHVALLGEYGQGKSTSVLMFVHDVLQKNIECPRLPVLIELRGKSPKTQTPLEMLAAWGAYFGISGTALFAMLRAGKLLIIFDGFDEMDGLDDERMRYENFVALWRFAAIENSKILITGRPELFLDDVELRRDLAVHPDTATGPFTRIATLQRFDEIQMRDALRNIDQRTRDEIIGLALANASFMDIVSRPSLLQQVASIWNDPLLAKNKANIKSALIVELFLESTFRRQAEKVRADRSLQFMRLNQSELAFFTQAVAVYMASEHLPNQITNAQLSAAAQKVWHAIGDSLRFEARPELSEDQGALKIRLKDAPDAIEVITTNIRSYGVIVRDYSRSDTFKFSHKSYFELLAGKTAADIILDSNSDQHRLIISSLSPSMNDLLFSPVATSFCGESMGFIAQTTNEDSKRLLNKIYDYIARPSILSEILPRRLHQMLNGQLPALVLARRIVKAARKNKSADFSFVENIAIASRFAMSRFYLVLMTFMISSLVFMSAFWAASRTLIEAVKVQQRTNDFAETILSIFLVIGRKETNQVIITATLMCCVFMGFTVVNTDLFANMRAVKLIILSRAAVGQSATQKYYGRLFLRVVRLMGQFERG